MNIYKSKYDKKNFINSFFFNSKIINPYNTKKYERFNSENKNEKRFTMNSFIKKYYSRQKYKDLNTFQKSEEKILFNDNKLTNKNRIFTFKNNTRICNSRNNIDINDEKYKTKNGFFLGNNYLYKGIFNNHLHNNFIHNSNNKKMYLNFSFIAQNKDNKINIHKNNNSNNINSNDKYKKYNSFLIKLRKKFHGNILFTTEKKFKKETFNTQKILDLINNNKNRSFSEKNIKEAKCKFTNEILKNFLSDTNKKKYIFNNI